MKIITRHFIANYGSFLQTYATIKYFEELGYKPIVINYISKQEHPYKDTINKMNMHDFSFFKKILYFFIKYPSNLKSFKIFKKYRKKYLNETIEYTSLNKLVLDPTDIIISGSDQLWGRMPNGKIDDNYYLSFTNNKKIAFSSSFGSVDFSEYDVNHFKELLNRYSLISVREKSAKKFLQNNGIESFDILDPTLMVDRKIWDEMIIEPSKKEKYVLIYQIHSNSNSKEYYQYFERLGYKIYKIKLSIRGNLKNEILFENINPFYFIGLIKNAEYVITDSFHCTVFSILYHKNFTNIINHKTSSRIYDFLNDLNLLDRISSEYNEEIINNIINYEVVDENLNSLRKLKNNFFKEKLFDIIDDNDF